MRFRYRALLSFAIGLIFLATLTPQPGSVPGETFFAPLFLDDLATWKDTAQNILLYVPVGFVLRWMGLRSFPALATGGLVSLSTELLQLMVPGRFPMASDILANALGAFAGWSVASTWAGGRIRRMAFWVVDLLTVALRPGPRTAARLSLAWSIAGAATIAATCVLLSPDLPEPSYYLVSAPEMDDVSGPIRIGGDGGGTGGFRGLIDEVRIYSAARTSEEISGDMRAAVGDSPGDRTLVAAFGFDSRAELSPPSSGSGTRLVIVRDAVWTPSGRFGGALSVGGRSEVTVPGIPELRLRRSMTIEAWVNPDGRQRGRAAVVARAGDAYFLRASRSGGALAPSGGGRFGEGPVEARFRGRIPAGEWSHLAVTYDGQTIRLYVNGRVASEVLHWSSHHPRDMSINEVELRPGLVARPSHLRKILSGEFTFRLTIACGTVQEESARAFALVGLQSRDVLTVHAAGTEVRLGVANRAQRLGLAPVEYRVPHALSTCVPGGTATLVAKGPLQNLRLGDASGRVWSAASPGIGSAWAFFLDSRLMPAWLMTTASAVYLGGLLLPLGFWGRAAPATILGGVLFLATLCTSQALLGTPPVNRLQAVGMTTGFLLGIGLQRWATRRREDDVIVTP